MRQNMVFFFQAEDGIRDGTVTGVQTCALPISAHWNGKFLGVGNGALTGAIWHTSMVRPLQGGYAVANSDLGHPISTANWALGHPEKVLDYANRGDHVTAQASKAIV